MFEGLLYKLFFLNTLSPLLTHLLKMIPNTAGLSKFLGKIRSLSVVYNEEDKDYFFGGGMGVTTMDQHKLEISDSKPTSKPSYNKVKNFRIEEVDFCTAFVGGVPGNKICGLMKGYNGSCNKYKTHAYLENVHVDSAFYFTTNDTNLFLKHMVSLIIGDANQAFFSQVG